MSRLGCLLSYFTSRSSGSMQKKGRYCNNFLFRSCISASLVIDIQWNVKLLPFISLESNEYFMCGKKQPLYIKALQHGLAV